MFGMICLADEAKVTEDVRVHVADAVAMLAFPPPSDHIPELPSLPNVNTRLAFQFVLESEEPAFVHYEVRLFDKNARHPNVVAGDARPEAEPRRGAYARPFMMRLPPGRYELRLAINGCELATCGFVVRPTA
jgi:hypothetical protein